MALEPEDIARSILFALSQPRHVQVAQMVVLSVNRWYAYAVWIVFPTCHIHKGSEKNERKSY